MAEKLSIGEIMTRKAEVKKGLRTSVDGELTEAGQAYYESLKPKKTTRKKTTKKVETDGDNSTTSVSDKDPS